MLCSVVKYEEAARARKKCGEKHETYSSVSPHFLIVNRWLMITLLAYHDSTYNINQAFLFQTSSPLNQWYFTNNIRLVLIFHFWEACKDSSEKGSPIFHIADDIK